MPESRPGVQQAIAVLGVIVSLVFVGYEIRQNTRVSRAATVQSIAQQVIEWHTASSQDADWMRLLTFLEKFKEAHK